MKINGFNSEETYRKVREFIKDIINGDEIIHLLLTKTDNLKNPNNLHIFIGGYHYEVNITGVWYSASSVANNTNYSMVTDSYYANLLDEKYRKIMKLIKED